MKHLHSGLLWCIALILGGAIGNVVDSTLYGVWLNNANPDAVTPWFHGKVVDMFYLDIWEGYVADWVPLWGGEKIALWPIFNVADAAIFVGVFLILIFQKRFFARQEHSAEVENISVISSPPVETDIDLTDQKADSSEDLSK